MRSPPSGIVEGLSDLTIARSASFVEVSVLVAVMSEIRPAPEIVTVFVTVEDVPRGA